MYMFMALPPISRLCLIRLYLPTADNASPTPEWSDVAFAYLRELHQYDKNHPGELPNILCLVQGMAMVDFHAESRWSPYAGWFFGRCPEPSRSNGHSLVNVVIGAGDAIDTYFTPGCVNLLITGYGIPPHKINWMTDTAWKYDAILTMSPKHSQVIDDLREKAKALAMARIETLQNCGATPDLRDCFLRDTPLKMTIVVPPNAANIGQLVATLKTALEACVPESEKNYG